MVQGSVAFSDLETDELMRTIGRHDIGAAHFVDDVEAILSIYVDAEREGLRSGLPRAIIEDLKLVGDLARRLGDAIGRLPADVSVMVNLRLASEDARQRIVRDIGALMTPLDDLSAAVSLLSENTGGTEKGSRLGLIKQMLCALAEAYRNRFNIRPRFGPDELFPRAVTAALAVGARKANALEIVRDGLTQDLMQKMLGAFEEKEEKVKNAPARITNPFLTKDQQDGTPVIFGD